ncbi:MAG: hypothetical protein E7Z80_08075 [Methanobrevibacter thaueri]|nr:hypothetical protein [Methanobrevibacter thaueri]
MKEKYIRKNKKSYTIYKNSTNYGKFTNLNDAIIIRNILIKNNWNLNQIQQTYKINNTYIITSVIDEKIHLIAKYKQKPSKETINKLIKKQTRNPNNSKYGLNVTKIFDTYIIKKQIAQDDYIFGYYNNLQDAQFVRNFLMDNMWDTSKFTQIQYDSETKTYKLIEIINDKIYVLNTFKNKKDINITKEHENFLTKISKHKMGLASHPHLEELTNQIPDLEKQFNTTIKINQNPLETMFNLTPFQKIVYDSLDGTFEEITQSLIRYKSKNFTQKIQKNLDELIEMKLVVKNNEKYEKIKKN